MAISTKRLNIQEVQFQHKPIRWDKPDMRVQKEDPKFTHPQVDKLQGEVKQSLNKRTQEVQVEDSRDLDIDMNETKWWINLNMIKKYE